MARTALSVLLAAAVALVALAGCASDAGSVTVPLPPRGAPPVQAGLVVNALEDRGTSRRAELARTRALGVRWIREQLRWGAIERQPGRFRWGRFDRLLVDASVSRLHVLPLLIGTPRWAGRAPFALPDDPDAYGAFAAQAAARYGPGGTFWRAHPKLDGRLAPVWFELWNEPYTLPYSSGGVDPARYARMVRAATRDGHAANSRTRWLMAADLTYQDGSGARRDWIAALAAADPGLLPLVDGVAVHPYSYVAPGSAGVALPFRFDRIGAIARELTAHGAARAPLWITEIGWSTCDKRPDCGSEYDQAQRIADVFTRVRRRPLAGRVQAVFVYHLHDFPGHPASDREAYYGLLRANGTRKPAWAVVRREALLAVR